MAMKIQKSTTIKDLRDAKKIYEDLNKKETDPNLKKSNNAYIAKLEKAEKQIISAVNTYDSMYPGVKQAMSTNQLIWSVAKLEGEIKNKSGRDISVTGLDESFVGVERVDNNVASNLFTDKDGKFNSCRVEKFAAVAGIGALGVSTGLAGGAFSLVGTAMSFLWGLNPVTAVAAAFIGLSKLTKLLKVIFKPAIDRYNENKAKNEKLDEAEAELDQIGKPKPVEPSPNQPIIDLFQAEWTAMKDSGSTYSRADVVKLVAKIMTSDITDVEKNDLIKTIKDESIYFNSALVGNKTMGTQESAAAAEAAYADPGKCGKFKDAYKAIVAKIKANPDDPQIDVEINNFKALFESGKEFDATGAANQSAAQLKDELLASIEAVREVARQRGITNGDKVADMQEQIMQDMGLDASFHS